MYNVPSCWLVTPKKIKEPKMDQNAVQIVVSVSKKYPNLKNDLMELANQEGRSLSNLVTLVLANFVESNRQQ